MPRISSLLIAGCILFAATALASAQQIHLPPAVSQSQSMGNVPVTTGNDIQRQQAIAANQQRQVEIRRDTEKMSELMEQLKDALAKSGQSSISMDAIRKAEQIEKLAHSVKSKMKQLL